MNQLLSQLLQEGIEGGVFQAASAAIWKRGKDAIVSHAGECLGVKAKSDTLYDLASLTKVFFTTTEIAKRVEGGSVKLSDRLTTLIPDLEWHADWSEVELGDVLSQSAGFQAWKSFWGKTPKDIFAEIASMPASYSKGTRSIYSDLGFILLGKWLLPSTKLKNFMVCPKQNGVSLDRLMPSGEVAHRGGLIQGDVHDDNAYSLGGMAGHAGLFGTVEDCLELGRFWMDSLLSGTKSISKDVASMFVTAKVRHEPQPHVMGWMVPSAEGSSAGSMVSKNAFGHLGFTGTSIWLDPDRQAVVILLTNRTYPSAENQKIKGFRPKFHDAIWSELDS